MFIMHRLPGTTEKCDKNIQVVVVVVVVVVLLLLLPNRG
jgi:hypothetical protein